MAPLGNIVVEASFGEDGQIVYIDNEFVQGRERTSTSNSSTRIASPASPQSLGRRDESSSRSIASSNLQTMLPRSRTDSSMRATFPFSPTALPQDDDRVQEGQSEFVPLADLWAGLA